MALLRYSNPHLACLARVALMLTVLAGPPASAQAILQPFGSECWRFGRTPSDHGGCWVRTTDGDAIRLKEGAFGRVEAEPIPNQGGPYREPLQQPGY